MGLGLIARGVIWPAGKEQENKPRGRGFDLQQIGCEFRPEGRGEILDSSLSVGSLFLTVEGIEP